MLATHPVLAPVTLPRFHMSMKTPPSFSEMSPNSNAILGIELWLLQIVFYKEPHVSIGDDQTGEPTVVLNTASGGPVFKVVETL